MVVALAALAVLSGCASRLERAAGPSAVLPSGEIPEDWDASGRLGVKVAEEGFNASFRWQERRGVGRISVEGPLGTGRVLLTLGLKHLRIESGSAPPVDLDAPFDDLDALLTMRLGFALPVPAMRFWMLGVPDPSLPSGGQRGDFEQLGWQVSRTAAMAVVGVEDPLPAGLLMTREKIRIRWVIDRWQVYR
jgi:outer membrane lipoprotein LolB